MQQDWVNSMDVIKQTMENGLDQQQLYRHIEKGEFSNGHVNERIVNVLYHNDEEELTKMIEIGGYDVECHLYSASRKLKHLNKSADQEIKHLNKNKYNTDNMKTIKRLTELKKKAIGDLELIERAKKNVRKIPKEKLAKLVAEAKEDKILDYYLIRASEPTATITFSKVTSSGSLQKVSREVENIIDTHSSSKEERMRAIHNLSYVKERKETAENDPVQQFFVNVLKLFKRVFDSNYVINSVELSNQVLAKAFSEDDTRASEVWTNDQATGYGIRSYFDYCLDPKSKATEEQIAIAKVELKKIYAKEKNDPNSGMKQFIEEKYSNLQS